MSQWSIIPFIRHRHPKKDERIQIPLHIPLPPNEYEIDVYRSGNITNIEKYEEHHRGVVIIDM